MHLVCGPLLLGGVLTAKVDCGRGSLLAGSTMLLYMVGMCFHDVQGHEGNDTCSRWRNLPDGVAPAGRQEEKVVLVWRGAVDSTSA
jgi:hypothetical protein